MADVLIFDPDTKDLIELRKSVHTPDYEGKPGVIINPVIPRDVEWKYLKVTDDNKSVVSKDQATIDQIDADDAAAAATAAQQKQDLESAVNFIKGLVGADVKIEEHKPVLEALIRIVASR